MFNFWAFLISPSKFNHQQRRKILPKQVSILADLSLEQLHLAGIKGILLDLDNTIISEDDRFLSPHAEDWIKQAKLQGLQFYILSNGKRHYRVIYWSKRLNISAFNPAKKPFPKSFRKAMQHIQLPPIHVAVIGDSLHTDALGAWLTGCAFIHTCTLPHPPRWWEKLFGKWVQIPLPSHQELWNFEGYD